MGNILIKPQIYNKFKCKADKCKHTCCRGWEIDVDEDTMEQYKKLPGPVGDKLRANIVETEDGYSFKLTEDERCPMLDENNLCEIIKEHGEGYLCDICTLHPRFMVHMDESLLIGSGLCCEKTCELLDRCDKLKFTVVTSEQLDGKNVSKEETMSMEEIVDLLELMLDYSDVHFRPMKWDDELVDLILDLYEETEPIDSLWEEQIQNLKKRAVNITEEEKQKFNRSAINDNYYEKIFQYILFRQLDKVEYASNDYIDQVIGSVLMSTDFIRIWDALEGRDLEHVRRWSEQIEYSTENVRILIES